MINDGPHAITDFRLTLEVNGATYALTPFEGSIENPQPLLDRRIEPGGQLDVPVMTGGYDAAFSVAGLKRITLRATLNGPPGTVTDTSESY